MVVHCCHQINEAALTQLIIFYAVVFVVLFTIGLICAKKGW